jgi:hypothetical protein
MASELASRLKTSLDELRMQVLGAQVLLGFQFQSLFQARFQQAVMSVRAVAAIGLVAICISLAGLIAPPAQHRLVEQGDASARILRIANRCAEVSLGLLALALGSDVYVAASLQGSSHPSGLACAAILVSVGMWFGVGLLWRESKVKQGKQMIEREEVDIHTKIEQMLTESRVILPGAQAMLGFQLIVTMTDAFDEMAARAKNMHFVALGAVILSVVLLIAPAAVHRLSFAGRDDRRFHRIGSRLITAALVPLAAGIALDLSVATWRLSTSASAAIWGGVGIFSILIGVWYVWPLSLRGTRFGRKQA